MREMWVARAARLIAIAHRLSGSRPVRMWLAGTLKLAGDGVTLTFVPTGSMQTARDGATATLLADGKILVAGGEVDMTALDVDYFVSAELYDPASGTFSGTGSLTTAPMDHVAARLADGRVGRGA